MTVGEGGEAAFVGSIVPEAGDMLQLWIVYPDGVVEVQAAGLTEGELVTAGSGVHRSSTGFEVTPPACFTAG